MASEISDGKKCYLTVIKAVERLRYRQKVTTEIWQCGETVGDLGKHSFSGMTGQMPSEADEENRI